MHIRLTVAALVLAIAPVSVGAQSSGAQSSGAQSSALPEWLAGSWSMEQGANWADEFWTSPRGGIMLGSARIGFGSELHMWEATRIMLKPDGTVSLFAQPRGKPASEFPMVRASENAIEFANPEHDYPQRIRYERVGQLLIAEISRMDGSEAMRWQYRPVEMAR